jgi:Ca-activated chloride channel family protein
MPADGPKLAILGKLVIFLVIAGSLYGAYHYLYPSGFSLGKQGGPALFTGKQVEIGIAYGTEKERWLQWAADEFAKTGDGRGVKINLIPMGSLEGAQAIVGGDQRINVWAPASGVYKETFVQDWQSKYNSDPIVKQENLALTPMVIVMWDERYQAFIHKYKTVTFSKIGAALMEKGGWNSIAGKPDWGLFKFGHTNPNESNSGLLTLVLMAYDYTGKTKGLGPGSVVDVGFQTWLRDVEAGASCQENSTGNLMKDMVLKGPSVYDAVFVYESVAIDYLKNAEGRWGNLRIVYPQRNMWNDNPYYIINASWSTQEQRDAADKFLQFLMSEAVQKQALTHGFRPANVNVPVRFSGSPFVVYEKYGLKPDIGTICEAPKADVINNLLASWQRSQAR